MKFLTRKSILMAVVLSGTATQAMAMDVEIVPAWSVLVVDAAGKPVPNLSVNESWEFFGISSSGSDSRATDIGGRVTFPRRSFSVAATSYIWRRGMSQLSVHASFGGTGSVMIHPEGRKIIWSFNATDGKIYDDPGAHTQRTEAGFETTLRVLARDLFDFIHDREWDGAKHRILENPSTVSMRGPDGSTPLVEVAGAKFTGQAAEVLRLLVERGADVNAQADDGKTALHWAAQNHDLTEMEYLLGQKADPNPRIHDSVYYTSNGFTPLHFQLGAYECLASSPSAADRAKGIEVLLEHGADINAKDAKGNTPLHLAAEWGEPEIVSALLAHGADARSVNSAGQTPLALIQSLQETPPVRRLRSLLSAAQATRSK